MTKASDRSLLIQRLQEPQNGKVNWVTNEGNTDKDAAQAWIEVCTKETAGQGTIEVDLARDLIKDQKEKQKFFPDLPIEIIDLGCGTGEKAAIFCQSLSSLGFQEIHYTAVDAIDVLVNHAEHTVRQTGVVKNFSKVIIDFVKALNLSCTDRPQKLYLLLGNTINTFEPQQILPPLAGIVGQGDWLVVGFRYCASEISTLSAPVSEQTIDGRAPQEIYNLLKGYYDFNNSYPVFKAYIAGLEDNQFNHHVEFDFINTRINRFITIENIPPDSEQAKLGFRNGQKIYFSFTRYAQMKPQLDDLLSNFCIVDYKTHVGNRLCNNTAVAILNRIN